MILCDTGPIVSAILSRDDDHQVCADFVIAARRARRRLLVPATVVAEVGYLVGQSVQGAAQEALFLSDLSDGLYEPVDLTPQDYARMSDLVAQYNDLPLGTTDASVIALAERLDVIDVATLDRRHFRVVRPAHVASLTLLPEGIQG
jgi:predicted nucleic acid-binding protein